MIEPALSVERIEALETRAAYQEKAFEDLDASLTEAWRAIEALKRQVAGLKDRLTDAEAATPAPPEKRPPHF